MERKAIWFRVCSARDASRKLYKATRLGKQGLALAKVRVREFTGEAMKH